MARIRIPLMLAFVSAALLLAAFGGATAASFPLWFRYRSAPGLSVTRTVSQVAAGLTALGLFATAAIVASAAALQPAGRWRKLLYVLPIYLIGLTLAGVLLFILGIGTVGGFTTAWIVAGVLLSLTAVAVAAVRLPLGDRVARVTMSAMRVAAALGALTWLAMAVTIVIVLTSAPSAAPARQGGAQSAPGAPAEQRGGGEGFGPGGPGGLRASTTPLLLGGVLMTVFTAGALASGARGARALRGARPAAGAPALRLDYRYEAGRAVFSAIAVSIVGLAVAQLVPIAHDNPPAQTAVQWDSPQTQDLARRACMDCHSNETTWPWYAYVAPGSWLLRNHVSSGREHFNLSALNSVPAFRRSRLIEDVAQQIRNDAMPPSDYLIIHPEARLSDAEKMQLMQGLQESLTSSLPQ